jgi:mono/diheme cytochrome c family protein
MTLVRRAVATATLAAAALATAGCGTGGIVKSGDASAGKPLFVEKCGSCHTLGDAGTKGTIGPDLDAAFAAAREQGFKESTIRNVVVDQIRDPITETPTGVPGMPANLVKGQDAKNVSAYVASVAGTRPAGAQPPPPAPPTPPSPPTPPPAPSATPPPPAGGNALAAGKQVFETAGCASCHTLADADAHGTVGPNLDEAKPPKSLVIDRVTHGKGVMPSFKDQLTEKQINDVAAYVSSMAGKS